MSASEIFAGKYYKDKRILFTYLLPPAIWLYFSLVFGKSFQPQDRWLYILLSPTLIYLLAFLGTFQRDSDKGKPFSRKRRAFLVIAVTCGVMNFADGLGGWLNQYRFEKMISSDWRYDIYHNGWLKKRGLNLPPLNSSSKRGALYLPPKPEENDGALGPYSPNSSGNLINSAVNINKWGFRRETPEPFPDLSLDETNNILLLGGSVVFSMTTKSGDITLADMMQSLIREKTNSSKYIRILSGAIPGYTWEYMTNLYQRRYHRLNPKLVFWYESINSLFPGQHGILFNRNSIVLTLIEQALVKYRSIKAVKTYDGPEKLRDIRRFVKTIRNSGSEPIFILFAMPYTSGASDEELEYWDEMQNGQGSALAAVLQVDKINSYIRQIAAEMSVYLVDPLPRLNGNSKYFIDSCHMTQEGLRILAEELTLVIKKRLAIGCAANEECGKTVK